MDRRFVDKTVIVTGASSGIGAETARRFGAAGARVVLAARRREVLEAVAASIGAERALVVPTDVADLEGITALLEQAEERFGRIDVVVNCAGTFPRGLVEKTDASELMKTVDVNLKGPVALSRLALPYLRRAGGGAIVNVSSLAGHIPLAGVATYAATKAGLRMFSLSLAEELKGTGITVSVVSPGPVDTEFFKGGLDDSPDITFFPSIRSAAEVAAAILDCAHTGTPARMIPRFSGWMTNMGALFPRAKQLMAPLLASVGRSHKRRYQERRQHTRP